MHLIPPQFRALFWLAVAAALVATGWAINGWRLGGQMAEKDRAHAEAAAAAAEIARLKERSWSKQLEDARNAATQRETVLRRDAAGARQSADGLRDELAELRRNLPSLADDAVRERADTLAELLGACTAEYRSMAESADRLTSDRQTLMEAWPK